MKSKSSKDIPSLFHCANIGPDDGKDARDFHRKANRPLREKPGRKALQLCAQVAETLNLVLADSGNPWLHSLIVLAVVPAPNATQLLVTLGPLDRTGSLDADAVQRALAEAAGWLRSEVAAVITRRRAPGLILRFVPASLGEVTPS